MGIYTPKMMSKSVQVSGIPRILEWEGSMCRRRRSRGMENGEEVSPPYWGKGLGRGLCPLPRKFFVFFVENAIFDAF